MNFYHEINPSTGEITQLTGGKLDPVNFHYLRELDDDWIFFNSWRKVWPNIKPLLSELKIFRRYINADRRFQTVGDRKELQPQ
ncbi:hypothetical protein [Pseudomonas sp. R5(2019)]|uniref:hypothetical protein n=1 Tax=Pseudomonas sp. R5(2019) TaxID=2697566 RepID=UPI0014131A1A|nr:hypothetical protein [Pseudomonas sp. R5(2019)]NBA94381.1 hypothetical protein [Pseudomonas sp. R5(2019)]